jgi:hypothetical protein
MHDAHGENLGSSGNADWALLSRSSFAEGNDFTEKRERALLFMIPEFRGTTAVEGNVAIM